MERDWVAEDEELFVTRDTQLWYRDGTVVLQAERKLFKVYAGILSRASPVFRDMFALGSSHSTSEAGRSEMYEGRPLVATAGDTAADMRAFLTALHDSSLDFSSQYIDAKSLKLVDIPRIISILRLSTKYDVVHLRRRAIEALQVWYPRNVSSYISLSSSSTPREDLLRHITIANIARETGSFVLLPAALLFCCSTADARTLYDGVSVDGVYHDLHPDNKRAIFIGRPLLMHHARTRTQGFFFNPHFSEGSGQKCLTAERCAEFRKIYTSVYDHKEDPWMNPFFRLNWKAIRSACCTNCTLSWETHNLRGMKDLWEELPALFDLTSWAVVEEYFESSVRNLPEHTGPLNQDVVPDADMHPVEDMARS
ncbi:hypothetical protein BDW22DRAFT_1333230 [Trametopsis cervina]|nr:hypothetical protein BDW22DRAFT_1333230 [Trametopsis cervina]